MKVLNVTMILALTLLTSCGGSKSGGSNSKSKQGSESNPVKSENVISYVSDCKYDRESEIYEKIVMVVSYNDESNKADVTIKDNLYEKAGCKGLGIEMKLSGYTFSDKEDSSLKFQIAKQEWTPHHEGLVNLYNEDKECGLSWKKGRTNDVTETECAAPEELEFSRHNNKDLKICMFDEEDGSNNCMILKKQN